MPAIPRVAFPTKKYIMEIEIAPLYKACTVNVIKLYFSCQLFQPLNSIEKFILKWDCEIYQLKNLVEIFQQHEYITSHVFKDKIFLFYLELGKKMHFQQLRK